MHIVRIALKSLIFISQESEGDTVELFNDYVGRGVRPQIKTLAQELGVDMVIGCSPENFPFISNGNLPNLTYIRSRCAFACVDARGVAFVVMFRGDESIIKEQSWISDFAAYREFEEEPIDFLADQLRSRGFADAQIGMDLDFLPATALIRLKKLLPGAKIVDTSGAIAARRWIKTREEILTIESAARATQDAVQEAFARAEVGQSEREICADILQGCLLRGARTITFATFGSGENAVHVHCYAGHRRIMRDDAIRCDIGPRFQSWMGDLARTYSGGAPTIAQRRLYFAMMAVQKETIAAIRPGVTAASVYQACVQSAAKHRCEFSYSHVGHSFGLELHEAPLIRPGDHTVLRPGMVINIEPMIRDRAEGLFMHTEDLVEVTESGARVMTMGLAPDELPVIGKPL